MKKLFLLALFTPLFFLSACALKPAETLAPVETPASETPAAVNTAPPAEVPGEPVEVTGTAAVDLANPASTNCEAKGGKIKITARGDAGQYGICYFEDNRQCEEWALLRGDCPEGGRKVTGYQNKQQIYCAITGGETDIVDNICTIKGQTCDLEGYYNGSCPKPL